MKVKQKLLLLGGVNNLYMHKDFVDYNEQQELDTSSDVGGNNHLFDEEYSNVPTANPMVCPGTLCFSISTQYIYCTRSLLLPLPFWATNTSDVQRNPP
jgi:hypothetical protein